jgi:hypothetical protein
MQGREALAPGPPEVTAFLRGGLLGIQIAASLRASRKLGTQEGAREPGFNILRIVTDRLDNLKPEERNRVYKMLNLTGLAHANDNPEVKWVLGGDPCRDNATLLQGGLSSTTGAFRFRALLTDVAPEVRVKKVAGN